MKQAFSFYALSEKKNKSAFRIHLLVFLLATPAIWIVWLLVGTNYPWPLWSTAGWTLGVVFHYLGVFVFRKKQLQNN